jgi:hypothetical protein
VWVLSSEPVNTGRFVHPYFRADPRWYRYLGDGQRNSDTGGVDFSRWAPGSGEQITDGWQSFFAVVSIGDSTLVSVRVGHVEISRYIRSADGRSGTFSDGGSTTSGTSARASKTVKWSTSVSEPS